MDDFERWAVRIALRAAPDERDLAAHIARAYAAGGRGRRDLFRSTGHAPGGVGGGLATVLPELLDAVAFCADAVHGLLGEEPAIAAGALLAALGRRGDATSADEDSEEGGEADSDTSSRERRGPTEAVPPRVSRAAVYAALRLRDRLRTRGLNEADAERLACDVLAELLAATDPSAVAAFLDRLVANEAPEPLEAESPASGSGFGRRLRGVLGRRRARQPRPPPAPPEPGDDPDGRAPDRR